MPTHETHTSEFKGIWIPVEILQQDLTPAEKLVLALIHNFTESGKAKACYLRNEDIAALTGINFGSLKNHIRPSLTAKGYLNSKRGTFRTTSKLDSVKQHIVATLDNEDAPNRCNEKQHIVATKQHIVATEQADGDNEKQQNDDNEKQHIVARKQHIVATINKKIKKEKKENKGTYTDSTVARAREAMEVEGTDRDTYIDSLIERWETDGTKMTISDSSRADATVPNKTVTSKQPTANATPHNNGVALAATNPTNHKAEDELNQLRTMDWRQIRERHNKFLDDVEKGQIPSLDDAKALQSAFMAILTIKAPKNYVADYEERWNKQFTEKWLPVYGVNPCRVPDHHGQPIHAIVKDGIDKGLPKVAIVKQVMDYCHNASKSEGWQINELLDLRLQSSTSALYNQYTAQLAESPHNDLPY